MSNLLKILLVHNYWNPHVLSAHRNISREYMKAPTTAVLHNGAW